MHLAYEKQSSTVRIGICVKTANYKMQENYFSNRQNGQTNSFLLSGRETLHKQGSKTNLVIHSKLKVALVCVAGPIT